MNSTNDGCFSIFQGSIIVIAIIAMIIISIAGVTSMGFFGIFAGPIIVGIIWLALSGIFS